MAREIVLLECEKCKRRNYTTTINKSKNQKVSVRKFCPTCRSYNLHTQRKAK